MPLALRSALALATAALLVIGLFAWCARRDGRLDAEAEAAAQASASAARQFEASRQRFDTVAKAAREAVVRATPARSRVTITGPKTLEVEGTPVPIIVPPQVTELIARQDTVVAFQAAALLQAEATIAKADTALALKDVEIATLKRRIPRFGFKTGVVAGVVAVLVVAAALR